MVSQLINALILYFVYICVFLLFIYFINMFPQTCRYHCVHYYYYYSLVKESINKQILITLTLSEKCTHEIM